jgi:hypothetical protein
VASVLEKPSAKREINLRLRLVSRSSRTTQQETYLASDMLALRSKSMCAFANSSKDIGSMS